MLKILTEKRRKFNLETYILILDYEKALDQVSRQILWPALKISTFPSYFTSPHNGTNIMDKRSATEALIDQGLKQDYIRGAT
jgi:hypothetical protein